MKFTALSTALLVSSAAAFAPQPAFTRTTALQAETSTRSEFFVQLAGVVAASAAFPGVASAAQYGSLGRGSPNAVDPKEAIIDDEVLASAPVQKAIKDVSAYADSVRELKSTLTADGQVDLGPTLRKQFDAGSVRACLNTVNSAFDEDTQKGTDRLIRGVLQDLTELETANKQKEGIVRSERRINGMMGKIDKLQLTFDNFLKFTS